MTAFKLGHQLLLVLLQLLDFGLDLGQWPCRFRTCPLQNHVSQFFIIFLYINISYGFHFSEEL